MAPESPTVPPGLTKLGITDWPQALLCLPAGFTDYSVRSTLREATRAGLGAGEVRLFYLVVSEKPVVVPQPKPRVVLTATDGMLKAKIVVFMVAGAHVDRWKALQEGDRIHVRGELQTWAGHLQMTSPALVEEALVGRVRPRYAGRKGVIGHEAIERAVQHAASHHLEAGARHIADSFAGLSEADILREAKLTVASLPDLMRALHQPTTMEEGEAALVEARRLAAFSVVWHAKRMRHSHPVPESQVPITSDTVRALIKSLPVDLTADQRQAIREICTDLASPHPMRRILSGDVGTGKTYAYMIPALAVQQAGGLVVILTPNGLLVEQFVRECREAFGGDTPMLAVTGAAKGLSDLNGNPLLVGTTALLNRLQKAGRTPALLVVDEQQKFSIEQKAAMTAAGTNLLEATATPIPRSTALITHGAMDVSILRECPVAKNILTRIVPANEAARLFDHTRKVIEAGGQVAIIYPLVDDKKKERKSVTAAYERWEAEFPGRVGMVHGAMKEAEKVAAIAKLKAGDLDICVASTVIELGLTVPSLKSLVVVHAERYGVSQLHQLRGRVARHGGTGYFFMLLPQAVCEETMDRLRLIELHQDGFTLAEEDAQMRGYGDLMENGERQHGASRSALFVGVELTPEDIHQFSR